MGGKVSFTFDCYNFLSVRKQKKSFIFRYFNFRSKIMFKWFLSVMFWQDLFFKFLFSLKIIFLFPFQKNHSSCFQRQHLESNLYQSCIISFEFIYLSIHQYLKSYLCTQILRKKHKSYEMFCWLFCGFVCKRRFGN